MVGYYADGAAGQHGGYCGCGAFPGIGWREAYNWAEPSDRWRLDVDQSSAVLKLGGRRGGVGRPEGELEGQKGRVGRSEGEPEMR